MGGPVTAIFDIETDGLLDELTRVHCLAIRVPEWDATFRFRHNDVENTIEEGLAILSEAHLLVGHNIVHFDLKAIEKVYPHFTFKGRIRDTLVMSRMCFADEKERDFRRFARGILPGKYIGQHKLEAWGLRLGVLKGDYSEDRKAEAKALGITDKKELAKFVWGTWNQSMDDYCEQDIVVTEALWNHIKKLDWAESSTILEHTVHEILGRQEDEGIHFNVPEAERLRDELRATHADLVDQAKRHFGQWFAPAKKYTGEPRAHYGEDKSRKIWGDVIVPKRNMRRKINPKDPNSPLEERSTDAPYCPVVVKDFNPGSRPQIIDRLQTVHDWEPVDFTEKGNPEVNDDVLRNLAQSVPIAETLAEIFFYAKVLGLLETGDNAWLSKVDEAGYIHGYVNCGGTVTGRGSHVSPNLAQVPKVKGGATTDKDGNFNSKILAPDGLPLAWAFDGEGNLKKKVIYIGRVGDFGWECRSLFGPKPGWHGYGADLKGIEGRCLGGRLSEFDGGEYLDIVLHGDIHATNMVAFMLDDRDKSKTTYYALMYGAGDEKLGSIVCDPLTPVAQMKARGAKLRANFESGIPAFGSLMRKLKKMSRRGYIEGLDGRRVYVRSPHAVLNTQLQHDGAIIAKKWVILFNEYMEDAGLVWGWNGDYVQMLWIHDEIQGAARTPEIAQFAGEMLLRAAVDAGLSFNYPAPVEADFKLGTSWAETH